MFAPPAFIPLPMMSERPIIRQYVPPPMPTYVDPNAPVLPPPTFTSPEGDYTLIPNMMTNSTLLPPPMPIPSAPVTGFGGMSPAMAMAGMGMGGIPPGMFGMGGGPPASASPVAQGGPVAGPAYGQGNGTNGVPNPWPIRASFVTFNISGTGKTDKESGGQGGGGFGGLLGRGAGKKQEQQQQQAQKKKQGDAGSSDEDEQDDSAMNKLQYEATYGARGPGGKSRLPPRPKNNLRSTNSSFVTRVSASESFQRLVNNPPHLDPAVFAASHFSDTPPRGSNQPPTHWAFINAGRTLVWAYIDPAAKQKEPIMRMWFSANITAHAVCETTKVAPGQQGERLDILVGFATGDIVWVDPVLGKYTRFSKGGIVHPLPIVQIRWHPRIPTVFYVLYTDGNIFTFSTEKEDPPYLVTTVASPWAAGMKEAVVQTELEAQARPMAAHQGGSDSGLGLFGGHNGSALPPANGSDVAVELEIERQKAKRAEMMFVWKNEEQVVDKKVAEKQGGLMSWAGRNPVAVWKIGVKGVRQMEFSPDGQVLGVVSEDGTLKLIDVNTTKIIDVYAGYFGALTTLVWSPDGRYLLTGGQDDLITIYSPAEGRIVARCQGHSSYVTSIAFDRRRSNARGYRFGSVGEDGRVLYWDFSAASLQRPRQHVVAQPRLSMGSVVDLPAGARREDGTVAVGNEILLSGGAIYHAAPLRSDVAILLPVMNKLIEPCMMNSLHFLQEVVVTVSRAGGVKFWARPADLRRLLRNQKKERTKSMSGVQSGMRNLKVSSGSQRQDMRVGA